MAGSGRECALFGSAVTGEWWDGSDLNLLVVEDSPARVTSSAINYVFGDWALDTPRITKMVVANRLFQVDVYPSRSLQAAHLDWVLCDRLYHARPLGDGKGKLAQAIKDVQARRIESDVRAHRAHWYLQTSEQLLRVASGRPREEALAARIAAMLLGCAQLELVGQTKRSYKRLYRQCERAYNEERSRELYLFLYGLEVFDGPEVQELLEGAIYAVERLRSYVIEHEDRLEACPPGLHESLTTTLGISAGVDFPPGKGIVENLSLGDDAAALDCIRKATLWLANAVLRIEIAAGSPAPWPGGYLKALLDVPAVDRTIERFLVDLFGLDRESPSELRSAIDELATCLRAGFGEENLPRLNS